MHLIFLDLETKLGPKDLSDNHDEGWELLRNGLGGISVLCMYDSVTDWIYFFDEKSLSFAIDYIESADVVVTFCGSKFDIPVIEGIIGRRIRIKFHIDLYVEIVQSSAERGVVGRKGDFTLSSVCLRTFGKGKIGSGSDVGKLLKQGRIAELYNYCSYDVKLTKELFEFIQLHGGCQGLHNSFLPIPLPEWLKSR